MSIIGESSTVSGLFTANRIYVIPTFQRPYAWTEREWNDLLSDISVAPTRNPSLHYFGALHTVLINKKDDVLWTDYTDQSIEDIDNISKSNFRDSSNMPFEIHLLVDGQQRLLTLFSIFEHYLRDVQNCPLFVNLNGGYRIPKVILNTPNEHANFRQLLGLDVVRSSAPLKFTNSQNRLIELFSHIKKKAKPESDAAYQFLTGASCFLMRIMLSQQSLTPFLTLNDRGKDLTRLEKVKSLMMECDMNNGGNYAKRLHVLFADIYCSIDMMNSLMNEDDFLRQLAVAMWEGNESGPDSIIHELTESAIYDRFRSVLINNTSGNAIFNEIIVQSEAIIKSHNEICSILTNSKNGSNINIPSFANQLLSNSQHRYSSDDYCMVLESLKLQPKQLAVAFGIKNKCGIELHEVLGSARFNNVAIKDELIGGLRAALKSERAKITRRARMEIDPEWIVELERSTIEEINLIPSECHREITALYLLELLRIIVGPNKGGVFRNTWSIIFNSNSNCSKQQILDYLIAYIETFGSRYKFIKNFSETTDYSNQKPEFKHILREYECSLQDGVNAHRLGAKLQIEHFFPVDYTAIEALPNHGFSSVHAYENDFLERPGNKLMLSSGLNQAIKSIDLSSKFSPYRTGSYKKMNANPHTQSARQIYQDANAFKNSVGYLRLYVVARQFRMAAFVAQRF